MTLVVKRDCVFRLDYQDGINILDWIGRIVLVLNFLKYLFLPYFQKGNNNKCNNIIYRILKIIWLPIANYLVIITLVIFSTLLFFLFTYFEVRDHGIRVGRNKIALMIKEFNLCLVRIEISFLKHNVIIVKSAMYGLKPPKLKLDDIIENYKTKTDEGKA